jgi:hypothetical protein
MRKERFTPNGIPDSKKPIKIGIDEHEQKGVTVPSNAPIILPDTPLNLLRIRFVFSGVKCDWIYDEM